ncbi:hypothetical protein F4774DRAFT_425923 [Daldinia eschscholtzii]|nr:hypothetical protein F4774DRAFT_425923 [Daldinia eschscholtzii]
MDIFFKFTLRTNSRGISYYKDVLVVGKQKKLYDTGRFKADLFQLSRYVRSVFADQPMRRFVHAFSFYASKMELWVFDRSGAYSSDIFDIYDELDKFARAFVGYASDKRKLEVEQLNLAQAMGVEGVVKVVAHYRITSIAELRKGLLFSAAHRFRVKTMSITNKRKLSSDHALDNVPSSKRRRSCSQKSKPTTKFISKIKPSKILYRDIFSNNIIITKLEMANGFKVRDSGSSRIRYQIGTMQFMAIEVLFKIDHIYRHDFESFFYNLFCKWGIRSFEDIADAKEGHMNVNGLERIMGKFPKALDIVKPLCLKIRKIFFPFDKDERMSFGTLVGDLNQLYKAIIAVYDEVVSKL